MVNRSEFSHHIEIYTDGSNDGIRTATAVVAPNSVKTVRLPDNASIFTAEIHALDMALDIIRRTRSKDYVVLSDSYLLKGESQPVCEACHSPLTVKHFLVDCTRYSAARQRYFGVDTLKGVFENVASRNIITYVKDIGFYNCI